MFFGRRRESGIMDCEGGGWESSESISRDERPRCAVRCLAVARMEGGVRYGRGKGRRVLYKGRVIVA